MYIYTYVMNSRITCLKFLFLLRVNIYTTKEQYNNIFILFYFTTTYYIVHNIISA